MQEVRVAMALNGGVSLAVWMGGCAVELDRARRANRADGEAPRIYDALCECFGRRLVIDILTGASAGGINGALLSAAMVSGRTLDTDFVRKQWLKLGDLGDLLYPAAKDDPPALMDGEVFHDRLLGAFGRVLRGLPGVVGLVLGLPPRVLGPALLLQLLVAGQLALGFLEVALDPIRIHVDPFPRLHTVYSLLRPVSNHVPSG